MQLCKLKIHIETKHNGNKDKRVESNLTKHRDDCQARKTLFQAKPGKPHKIAEPIILSVSISSAMKQNASEITKPIFLR